jgi:hypothetical protein
MKHIVIPGPPPEVIARLYFTPDLCWWCTGCNRAVHQFHWMLFTGLDNRPGNG